MLNVISQQGNVNQDPNEIPLLIYSVRLNSVQSLSHVWLFVMPWIAARQASLSTPRVRLPVQLPEFTQTHVHRVGDAIQPSHPLSSPFPPAPIPPIIRVFSSESTLCMRWPKYWSFSFSIIPSKEHPGLISFRMDSLVTAYTKIFIVVVWELKTSMNINNNSCILSL